ncbi:MULTISPECIES: hypothetical protein [unclassified Campylobacter]|uniref:hypothetical protein n=1 Tax=unclassified Campylobacter TaxID=2593542 RepID=UPI003D33A04F
MIDIVFFKMIKNLEAMGGGSFCLWSFFMVCMYGALNSMAMLCEKVAKAELTPRWYDIVIMLVCFIAWLYGIWTYKSYRLG